jgi:NhaA family Na+:H+ antiporter
MNVIRTAISAPRQALGAIIEHPLAAGMALLAATALALAVANSGLAEGYQAALKTYLGPLSIGHWINDGLMAVFFLLVGLELKREVIGGELSSWDQRILPGIAAAGGIMLPALIFAALNAGDPAAPPTSPSRWACCRCWGRACRSPCACC